MTKVGSIVSILSTLASSRRRFGVSLTVLCLILKWWRNKDALRNLCLWWKLKIPQKKESNEEIVTSIPFPQPQSQTVTSNTSNVKSDCNSLEIKSVLWYWFDASPDTSQKRLWMISSSSDTARLEETDLEIFSRFSSTLLTLATSPRTLSIWCDDHGWEGKLASILVLDQLSRHIRRHAPEFPVAQKDADVLALGVSKRLTIEHSREISGGGIPHSFYIFGIMPFRHANLLSSVGYVQNCVEDLEKLHGEMGNMIRRFRRATNRRMSHLQDEARREGRAEVESIKVATSTTHDDINKNENENSNKNSNKNENENSNKNTKVVFSEEDILECFPFEAVLDSAKNHPVYQTVSQFLSQQIAPLPDQQKQQQQPVIVSLSGGVDSMVIAAVLAHLAASHPDYRHLHIIALHIDYNNRPQSHSEASYIQKFCSEHDITYRCRLISEITRGVTARDQYEKMSRKARYDFYKRAISEFSTSTDTDALSSTGVILGHHKGDIRENVLSNSMKGCGPLELSGMTEVGKVEGVSIWRPLLPLEKIAIFDYAHKYGVPYFKDTTPGWSTRGKLRNKLLPLLEEIYGDGSMTNLSNLAIESDEARIFFQQKALKPFFHLVRHHPMGISFETHPFKNYSNFFWKFVLKDLLHSVGRGMFSDGSTISFMNKIKVSKPKCCWLQSRKDYATFLRDDGRAFILHPDSFPWAKKDQYCLKPKAIGYGIQDAIQVGPWHIFTHIVNNPSAEEVAALLSQKAIPDMDQFMTGSITYYIQTPSQSSSSAPSYTHLEVVQQFTKASRPISWKGIDLKIQNTLPLIGNNKLALQIMGSDTRTDWDIVGITMSMDPDTIKKNSVVSEEVQMKKEEKNAVQIIKCDDPGPTVTMCIGADTNIDKSEIFMDSPNNKEETITENCDEEIDCVDSGLNATDTIDEKIENEIQANQDPEIDDKKRLENLWESMCIGADTNIDKSEISMDSPNNKEETIMENCDEEINCVDSGLNTTDTIDEKVEHEIHADQAPEISDKKRMENLWESLIQPFVVEG